MDIMKARNKLTTISLFIGAVALLCSVVLGIMYFRTDGVYSSLASELETSKEKLASSEAVSDLQEQLATINTHLDEVRESYEEARTAVDESNAMGTLHNGSIIESVLQQAADNRVEVTSISTELNIINGGNTDTESELDSEQESEKGSDQLYTSLSMELYLQGGLSDIAAFVDDLENGDIRNVHIDNIRISGEYNSYSVYMDLSLSFTQF